MLVGNFLLMLLSFVVLARVCSKYFVTSLDSIAKRWGLSSEAAGATLMAVGSSLPEFFITIFALVKPGNHGSIGVGTIVGSAVYNILVIVGAAVLVRGGKLMRQPVLRDMLFYVVTIALLVLSFWDGQIIMVEAFCFVAVYVCYVIAVINWQKWLKYSESPLVMVKHEVKKLDRLSLFKSLTKVIDKLLSFTFLSDRHYVLVFFISLIWIGFISWILVENAIVIAAVLGVPEVVISLSVLAIGTSIPDTIAGVIVAKEGRVDMAISNAIGSNVFNISFALGIPWLIMFALGTKTILVSTESLYSSFVLLFGSVCLVLFLFLIKKWQLGKWSGVFLIAVYILYLLFVLGLF